MTGKAGFPQGRAFARHTRGMLLALPLGAIAAGPTLAQLDALAKARDVQGLTKLVALPAGERNPFKVLRTNGGYDVGKYGWSASELKAPDGTEYVVLGTKLTSEDVAEIVLRRVGEGLRFLPEKDPLGVRPLRHSFDLRFDVPHKGATLVDRLRFRSSGSGSFLARMSAQYRVESVTDERGRRVPFAQASGVVALARPSAKEATYTFRYAAVVDLPMYAGSIGPTEATLTNDYWYPMIGRLPSSYDIAIHGPKGWTAVAQGEPQGENETATERVTRYRMDLPCVYFSVSAAPYRHFAQRINGRWYRVWSTRMTQDQMRIQTELYAPIIEFYSRTFGKFPFSGYGAVDSTVYGGGALEAYSFATYGGGLPQEDAHEPAHTWWGGMVNNTYLDSFWNESFADFSMGLYAREAPIGNRQERRLAFMPDGSAQPAYRLAAIAESGADVGPIGSSLGYGKGAQVLAMLEQLIGTEAIERAMRTWVATLPKGEPGNWPQFEAIILRQNPSKDVRGFFEDWIHRSGYAELAPSVEWRDGAVIITPNWKGKGYRMPLAVMVNRTFRTVWLDGTAAPVTIRLASKPELVSLDPWRQALREISPAESPKSIYGELGSAHKLVEPAHRDWMNGFGGRAEAATPGDVDPAGKFLVGSPETWPAMRALCERAGFAVHGNLLTYQGTTIDLRHGAALAVVDLEGGKRCLIGLGKTQMPPNPGRARLVLTDDLGRFVRGKTDPKTTGPWTFRL